MQVWIFGGWGLLAIIAAAGMVWVLMVIIDAWLQSSGQRSFKKKLTTALQNGNPSWTHVCTMADTYHIGEHRMIFAIKTIIRDGLTNTFLGLNTDKIKVLEGYLEEHKKQLPYEGLPTETRFMMDKVGKLLGSHESELHPLAAHIRELLKGNEPVQARQRFYTLGGFVIGVLGIAFTAYGFMYPPASKSVSVCQEVTPSPAGENGTKTR